MYLIAFTENEMNKFIVIQKFTNKIISIKHNMKLLFCSERIIEQTQCYLINTYIPKYNKKFSVSPFKIVRLSTKSCQIRKNWIILIKYLFKFIFVFIYTSLLKNMKELLNTINYIKLINYKTLYKFLNFTTLVLLIAF